MDEKTVKIEKSFKKFNFKCEANIYHILQEFKIKY